MVSIGQISAVLRCLEFCLSKRINPLRPIGFNNRRGVGFTAYRQGSAWVSISCTMLGCLLRQGNKQTVPPIANGGINLIHIIGFAEYLELYENRAQLRW